MEFENPPRETVGDSNEETCPYSAITRRETVYKFIIQDTVEIYRTVRGHMPSKMFLKVNCPQVSHHYHIKSSVAVQLEDNWQLICKLFQISFMYI